MPKILVGAVIFAVAALIIIPQIFFSVDETQMAIVTRLGEFKRSHTTPGLQIKTPFVESVTKFDKRLLRVDAVPASLLTADKRNLLIDVYARYRIVDPLIFFNNLGTLVAANSRVGNIVNSQLRQEVAQDLQADLISETREEVMRRVTVASNRTSVTREVAASFYEEGLQDLRVSILVTPLVQDPDDIVRARSVTQEEKAALISNAAPAILDGLSVGYFLPLSIALGVEIVDVRIKRADFPTDIATSVFTRMEAERERIASGLRAEGNQRDLEIRADVDRQVEVTIQTAEGRAALLVGEGEREAIKILAEALELDPEFYDFQRSLEAYRNTLVNTDTTVLLDINSDLFKFLQSPFGDTAGGN